MKSLAVFLVGAATGALATYLYFNNKINKIVEETVKEEMERFMIRQEQLMNERIFGDVEEVKEDEPKVSDVPETGEKTSIIEMENIVRTNYRPDNDGIEEDEEDEDEEYITDEEMAKLIETSQQRMSEKPHIISEEERDLCRGYDFIEFTWYPETDLLVEVTHDDPIEEPELYFGDVDWRSALKDKSEITIRDSHEATDYTIYNDELYGKE